VTGPLRLGIAGCGRIAERGYLPAVAGMPDVEIVAVADPDRKRAGRLAASAGSALAYGSSEEMFAAGRLDALVVAVPAAAHVEIARAAAAAGLPSLVEKPPAPDLAGALALAALEPAPALGFNRRFLQGAELGPAIPTRGWLELDLELRFRGEGWAAHAGRDEALLDAGLHSIDLAAFLTGSDPIAVRRAAVGPERAELELELARGRARIACATDRSYAERVAVADRSGRALAAVRTDRARARLARLRGGDDPLVLSLRRQLAAFATRVGGGDPGPLAGPAAGVAVMRVVEAARRSAELGGAEVTVGDPRGGAPASTARVGGMP
jgi:predicted dehydrogenase